MEDSINETVIKPVKTCENLIKPVPKPFSIEALISDSGPKRSTNTWESVHQYHPPQITKDTDSEGSLDLDLAQDLSRRSEHEGKKVFSFF